MKVRELFEITGDAKFDAMLGGITDKAKKGVELHGKLDKIAASLPDAFKNQEELERWISKELEKIHDIPSRMLSRFAKELKPIADGYREDTNPLELLYFHATNKDPHGHHVTDDENLEDVADAFIDRHKEDVQDALTSWLAAFDQLAKLGDAKKWPTGANSWKRITKFDSEYHHAKSIARSLAHNLK